MIGFFVFIYINNWLRIGRWIKVVSEFEHLRARKNDKSLPAPRRKGFLVYYSFPENSFQYAAPRVK